MGGFEEAQGELQWKFRFQYLCQRPGWKEEEKWTYIYVGYNDSGRDYDLYFFWKQEYI